MTITARDAKIVKKACSDILKAGQTYFTWGSDAVMLDACGRKIEYLRLSVTELCNLRCRYCMPEEGIACKRSHADMLTEDEMIAAVRAAAELGIRKVRITGGEPLVKKNILSICSRAAAVEGIEEVCLTTNGTLLPGMAKALRDAGVKRVNISVDSFDAEKYAWITRRGQLSDAMAGIEAALEAGFERVKLNAVLIGGFNDGEIESMAELTLRYPIDIRFIELMPMYDSGDFTQANMISADELLRRLPDLIPVPHDGGVAQLWQLPGAQGNVGIISPVSRSFCHRCNRLRLTADGRIKPCLHSSLEFNIKGLPYEEVLEQFRRAAEAKPRSHGELSAARRSEAGRDMNAIGG